MNQNFPLFHWDSSSDPTPFPNRSYIYLNNNSNIVQERRYYSTIKGTAITYIFYQSLDPHTIQIIHSENPVDKRKL